ncbi:MAG: hypothetical protein KGO81_01500 [Bacteroidota bacterium]|nr:hypothetical protein [Bacteroidota bacterium]
MIKYASIASLVTVITFVSVTFTAGKFQTFSNNIRFGWPFNFFTSEPEYIIGAEKQFSLLGLTADLVICFIFSLLVVQIIAIGKKPAKKMVKA